MKAFTTVLFAWLALSCAHGLHNSRADNQVLAEVNGEIIDEDDLKERIDAIHRYKRGMRPMGEASGISILDITEQLIDERIMIQEARRVELDRTAYFTEKIESFVATQSILRLRQEEVLDKIDVTEDDILNYFKEHYGSVDEERYDRIKRRIEKKLRKQRDKELSDNFVAELRKKANIWIDQRLFSQLDPGVDYSGKKSAVAQVNGKSIPIDDFLKDMALALQRQARMFQALKDQEEIEERRNSLKEATLERLITYELVEQEALGRNYVKDPTFVRMVEKREEAVLVNEFKVKLIYPLAVPTRKELRQYYNAHTDEFKRGYEVWLAAMRFQDRKDAEKILDELRQGAGFEFLAARMSERTMPKESHVWIPADRFSAQVRKVLNQLEVGEISDVIEDDRHFKIIKLKGKRGGEPAEFSKVADRLRKVVAEKKFSEVLSDYLGKVRKDSKIKIYENALKEIKQTYWKAE
jgi:parvulin-like peptidyl-prolyl isomerase